MKTFVWSSLAVLILYSSSSKQHSTPTDAKQVDSGFVAHPVACVYI